MTYRIPDPANDNVGPSHVSDDALDDVLGGAETVHLHLTSNGEDAARSARKVREIVVVGTKG